MNKIDSFSGEYRFLSNFYLAPLEYEGRVYPSSEHAYQAAKTLNDNDRRKIAADPNPKNAKRRGQSVFLRKNWDKIKNDVMEEIVMTKFITHMSLREKLIETGDAELIEGNTWGDTYWGVCNGVGENNLGKILMNIRSSFNNFLGSTDYFQWSLDTIYKGLGIPHEIPSNDPLKPGEVRITNANNSSN